MTKRVLTGIAFAAILAAGCILQGWLMRALLLLAMEMGVWEMFHALEQKGHHPIKGVGIAYCVMTSVFSFLSGVGVPGFDRLDPVLLALSVSLLTALSLVIFAGQPDFDRALSTSYPLLYPGLFFAMLHQLLYLHDPFVIALALALALFTASINDVFALFGGMRFGRHKLSPLISPKKTIEGSVCGLIASTLFAAALPLCFILAARLFPQLNPDGIAFPPTWCFLLLGFCAGALSQLGDLAASMVKRHCGIKDFGNVFPGHGGMMDRFDGILFASVACWVFSRIAGY